MHNLRGPAFSRSYLKGIYDLVAILKAWAKLLDTAKARILHRCLPLAAQIDVGVRALAKENDEACEAVLARKRRSGACCQRR